MSGTQSRSELDDTGRIRLQKVLASAGIASRRKAEELILAGRVSVDGQIVTELGTRIDPDRQTVTVDGARVATGTDRLYLALHKPRGMLSTMSDDRGRPCVGDLVAGRVDRLFHVGRLDADSEGLLLLTNDGELAQLLMHPSHGVAKTYLAEVTGRMRPTAARALRQGVALDDGEVRAERAQIVQTLPGATLVELTVHEGRKHVVRRMLAEVGHPVVRLVRTSIGPLSLGELRAGRLRALAPPEVNALYAAATPKRSSTK